MKPLSMMTGGLLLVAMTIFASASLVAATPDSTAMLTADDAQQTQTFAIKNMTCALCPITVHKAMSNVAGVKSVDVNFESKTATVEFDPAVTTVDEIAQSSTNAGYPAALPEDG